MTRRPRAVVVAAAVAAIVTAANASDGAYFSQSWGWVALAFLVPTTVLLILDRVTAPGRLRIAFVAFVGALGVWIALSAAWSISTSASVREVERMLVYVAVAVAVALVLRRGDGPGVLAGALAGITVTCGYALATRLWPERFDAFDDPINMYRLAEPLGYWNALGLLSTLGLVLAFGLASHSRRTSVGIVVAAAIPVPTLTLYFTFSRGAWAALVIGLMASIAIDPRRLRLVWTTVVVGLPSAVCVAYAAQHDALTTEDAPVAAATRAGQRVAVALCVAIAVSALAALGARLLANRISPSRRAIVAFDLALVGSATAVAVAALVAVGGPSGLHERFNTDPVAGVDLNDRLFSVSGNGRSEQLRVGWEAGLEQPLVGNGAGTFEYLWYEARPTLLIVRDGHSLYMETFAELGLVGIVLLGGALLVLVLGGLRARRQRFAASGFGALLAWMAASAFDWHWEMVGLTLTALLVGSAGLVAAERRSLRILGGRARVTVATLTSVLSVFAVWSLVGNQALFAGREAVEHEKWSDARDDTRRAQAILFWSHEPDVVRGDAAAGLGDREGALRSYRGAVATDPRNWVAWLRLAQVARGAESGAAYERVRLLNPLEEGLPGE
ncbi:MAG TPA: O-antigen ligase family protein [Gaiellaceae bacterium]